MPHYLAPYTQSATAHPLFKQRGIKDQSEGDLRSLGVYALPHKRALAYDGYKANIDIFVSATNRQMRLDCSSDGALLSDVSREIIALPHPPLAFLPAVAKMSPDQIDAIVKQLKDFGCEKHTSGKTTIFVCNQPSAALYPRLLKGASAQPAIHNGAVTVDAYGAFLHLSLCVSEFLRTNTYPSFHSDDEDHGDDMKQVAETMNLHVAYQVQGREPDPDAEDTTAWDQNYNLVFRPAHEAVYVAKPSRHPLSHNVKDPASVPNLPGIVFPYFHRMNRMDPVFMTNVLRSLFFRTLGDSRPECEKNFKKMKLAMSSLAATKEGQALAHILYGIQLAVESQTRLVVVLEHGYCGFVLLGAKWSLFDGRSWVAIDDAEDVQRDVAALSTHTKAINDICEILSKLNFRETADPKYRPEGQINPADVTSGVRLLGHILSRKIGSEAAEKMSIPLSQVAFAKSYKMVTKDNLMWAISSMTIDADKPLDDDLPLYITSSLQNIEDRVYQVLACFGPDAPSFRNASGSRFDIPKPGNKDVNEEVNSITKAKNLPHLLVGLKSITVAYQDMKKVLKDKEIVMDLKERAAGSRTIKFSGNHRDLLYGALKSGIHHVSKDEVEGSMVAGKGKKRKAEDDGGNISKKAATASDVLSAFTF